ncbi:MULTISPECIES: hypothetical protein [Paenisporosarcina]|nr:MULTISPECIES: hypothetical protein [Paenisporosarcina]
MLHSTSIKLLLDIQDPNIAKVAVSETLTIRFIKMGLNHLK